MTIGKELQKQRRAKQLSLEAVSQTLRVDQATLQKIEADDFQGLNPVMVRSCIRQYASLLGLDGAQLLDQFTEPAAAGKDIPAAKPAIPVKEKVTEVRAANPAPVKEASPAGKRVKQLSLLSGGERSLTALALLFAIFTARPSPFYVMDEVEAALDDVNLTRLINAFNELRAHAQLIIITHQQRTMSIADALYGVTMRADGVTAVVSQKLER